jgi:hypothetical protein
MAKDYERIDKNGEVDFVRTLSNFRDLCEFVLICVIGLHSLPLLIRKNTRR